MGPARLRALLDRTTDALSVHDRGGRLLYGNAALAQLVGVDVDALVGCDPFVVVHPDDVPDARAAFATLLAGAGDGTGARYRVRRADGECRVVETTGSNLLDDPEVAGVVLTTRDVTGRVEAETRYRHLATHDEVTALANRAALRDSISAGIVVVLDVDRFGLLDAFGNRWGDDALRQIAQRLVAAAPGAVVARLGGDEFAVAFPAVPASRALDEVDGLRLADELRAAVARPFAVGGRRLHLAVNAGVAVARPGSNPDEVLRDASAALSAAKQQGDGVVVFDDGVLAGLQARVAVEDDLRDAVEHQTLSLAYQPIVRLGDRTTTAFEALARCPRRRPDDFVPVAEETGLIVPLGSWVIGEAARAAASLPDDIAVNVNVSVRQLVEPGLAASIEAAAAAAGVSPDRLAVEVTESLAMPNIGEVRGVLERIRALGCRIGIDDFGTGHSSLAQLRRMPVDFVKIDRSFVTEVDGDAEARALVGGIVTLCDALDLPTVAEGVERPGQLDALAELGCDAGQGHLLGRPGPLPHDLTAGGTVRARRSSVPG